jgi:putative flippase GtrA
MIEDTGWFFDTELLVLAERSGLRIHEVPVDWVDDPDSRVDIVQTACDDLRGIVRLGWALLRGRMPLAEVAGRVGRTSQAGALGSQVAVFAVVGLLSTVAYAVLFLLLRGVTGAFWANATALVVTAVANTAANRRLTFGLRGPRHVARAQVEGLAIFALGLALTSGALAALGASASSPSRRAELAVLVAANAVATLARFLLFRAWVFHPRRHSR